ALPIYPSAGEEVLHPPAALFLEHGVGDDHIAFSRLFEEMGGGVGLERERTLDVGSAPAMEEAVRDDAGERRVLPTGRLSDVHRIEVRAEHHGWTTAAAGRDPGHVPHLVDRHPLEPEILELAAYAVRHLPFTPRRAGDADQFRRKADGAVEAEVAGHDSTPPGVVPTYARPGQGRASVHIVTGIADQPNSARRSWTAPSQSAPICLAAPSLTPWTRANHGASTSDTTLMSLIRMFIDGPDVSLNGSPTVSPTTAALCDSLPLPPYAPPSMYFLA